MPKIPPQSEPVDAKDLFRRLEVVVREREAAQSSNASKTKSRPNSAPLIADDAAPASKTPPPPTAIPTRPTSFNPEVVANAPPESVQVRRPLGNRLSAPLILNRNRGTVLDPNELFGPPLATDLQLVGQVARLGSKTTSRPSTSWNEKRNSREDQHDATDTGLDISMPAQRPKSMSNIHQRDANAGMMVDGPGIFKRDSIRQVQVVAQSVQIIDQQEPVQPFVAPFTPVESCIDPIPPTQAVAALDASPMSTPDLSSASTAVTSLSNSQSLVNGERKSWNPRNLFALLKDRNIPEPIVVHSDPTPSTALPTPEFKLDLILPPSDNSDWASHGTTPVGPPSLNGSNRGSWKGRPQTTAFETYNFSSNRFSGVSDLSSRLSDPHPHFNLNNMSSESIPTLMPGAEKSTRLDSHITIPADLQPRRAATDEESPKKLPYRESALRNELSVHEMPSHEDSDIGLSRDATEHESIDVSDQPEIRFHRQGNSLKARSQPSLRDSVPARRMTFSPGQFLSARTSYSQLDVSSPAFPKRNTLQHTLSATRPSTRSQPILIDGCYDDSHPQTPSYRPNSLLSSPQTPAPTDVSRFEIAPKSPITSMPPKVPPSEMQHMTAASIAFLRSQEMLLIQRSMQQLEHIKRQSSKPFQASGSDANGIDTSPEPAFQPRNTQRESIIADLPDFSKPRKAPWPEKRASHNRASSSTTDGLFHDGPVPYSLQDHPSTWHSRTQPTTASHTPRGGSISFTKIGSRKFLASRAPAGTVSMVDLNQSKRAAAAAPGKKKWKRHRWWKIWRLM